MVTWALVIALISSKYTQLYNSNKIITQHKIGNIYIGILILIGLSSIFVSNKVYVSLKDQMALLSDFNKGEYKTSLAEVINMDLTIPNVTVTTIPLIDIKARYLVNSKNMIKPCKYFQLKKC